MSNAVRFGSWLALCVLASSSLANTAGVAENEAEWQGAFDNSLELPMRVQGQLEAIDSLIVERGPYGQGLDEAYSGLGLLLLESEKYAEAAEVFRQAWHLSRIHSGLYSEEQLSHLNNLIHALAELESWEEVHDLHQLGFLISSKIYPPQDIRYVIAAEFYSSWQWKAINGRLSTDGMSEVFPSVQELSTFYSEVIDRVEHAGALPSEGLINLVLGKARTDITLARALLNPRWINSDLGPGSYITEAKCYDSENAEGEAVRQCRKVKLASFVRGDGAFFSSSFAVGRYLKQVEDSIQRLQIISAENQHLSIGEKQWIEQLILALKEESDAIVRAIRRG